MFSAACALAQNLPQMIVLRAVQGFTGGVLIPMAFTLIITLLPKAKQPIGLALFAISATFAPAIGPTIGGYLTENWGWQYIFYVNLVPGAVMIGMLCVSLEKQADEAVAAARGRLAGIVTMAIGLAALQTVLEEGNKDDWFGSPFIVRLSIVAAIALSAFLWIELTGKKPLLNLRLLVRRNFGFGILANFLLGIALYGSVFILPVYLSRIQGYNAEQIGMVLAWTGLPQLLLIPLVPRLMKRFDAAAHHRCRLCAVRRLQLHEHLHDQRLRGRPAASGRTSSVPSARPWCSRRCRRSRLPASRRRTPGRPRRLFNMMRNLGGAVGIALLQTLLTKREQYHSNVLTQSVSLLEQATSARIEKLTQYFMNHGVIDRIDAAHRAYVAIGKIVQKQAFILAFSDMFYLLGVALIVALAASMMLKKPGQIEAGGTHLVPHDTHLTSKGTAMLKDKVAIVTGSTSGIGLGIARELARLRVNLVLNGFGDPGEIEAIRSGIEREHGVRVVYDGADMSKGDAVRAIDRRDNRDIRTPRHPRQQCRHPVHRAGGRISVGQMACDPGHQSVGRVPRHRGSSAPDEEAALGPDRQHRLHPRPRRIDTQGRLRRGQARA